MNELVKLTVAESAALLNAGKISSVELCNACLQQLDESDPVIQAFLAVDRDHVKAAALESDQRRAAGKPLSP